MRWRDWHYGILLIAGYITLFQAWLWLDRGWVVSSGLIGAAVLSAMLASGLRRGYFANRWDLFFHASVIADLVVESVLIPQHQGREFLWCAVGFVVVVGGYRLRQLHAKGVRPASHQWP
jgi:hypothetical protein